MGSVFGQIDLGLSQVACGQHAAGRAAARVATSAVPKTFTVTGRNTFQRVGPRRQRRPMRVRPHRRAPFGGR